MTEDYANRFGGIGRLYGADRQERISHLHIAVVGIGGVGSWTVEALARTGVGQLTLIDLDEICITNVNRQLHARDGKIGQLKIEAMAGRARAINPAIQLNLIPGFFNSKSADDILDRGFDGVVDAIDSGMQKAILVSACHSRGIPLVTCGAAGGKCDPSRITVADLARTHGDPLLLQLRKTLRNRFDFPHAGTKKQAKRFGITAVYSDERPVYPHCDGSVRHEKPSSAEASGRLQCATGLGSSAPVTGTFGLIAAARIIEDILIKGESPD